MKRLLLLTSVLVLPLMPGMSGQANAKDTFIPCALSDLTLKIGSASYTATACHDNVANGGLATEVSNINASFGTNFVYLDKTDDAADLTGLGGITFVVTAPTNTNNGNWSVTWTDTHPGVPLDLPIQADFEIGVFGGNNGADYYLDNVLLPLSPNTGTGTFDITFLNGGGNYPDLSHLTLIGGNAIHVDPPAKTPEPATLAMLGVGLLGLGFTRRRRA